MGCEVNHLEPPLDKLRFFFYILWLAVPGFMSYTTDEEPDSAGRWPFMYLSPDRLHGLAIQPSVLSDLTVSLPLAYNPTCLPHSSRNYQRPWPCLHPHMPRDSSPFQQLDLAWC